MRPKNCASKFQTKVGTSKVVSTSGCVLQYSDVAQDSIHVAAPDTQIKNTDGRAFYHTCVTRWVVRGGVGITCFSNIHVRLTSPATYNRSKQYVFEKNIVMFRPHLDQLRGT